MRADEPGNPHQYSIMTQASSGPWFVLHIAIHYRWIHSSILYLDQLKDVFINKWDNVPGPLVWRSDSSILDMIGAEPDLHIIWRFILLLKSSKYCVNLLWEYCPMSADRYTVTLWQTGVEVNKVAKPAILVGTKFCISWGLRENIRGKHKQLNSYFVVHISEGIVFL